MPGSVTIAHQTAAEGVMQRRGASQGTARSRVVVTASGLPWTFVEAATGEVLV
jgi:acyl CoA:acetate/3-ketoacid CoA transferase alpha subunit